MQRATSLILDLTVTGTELLLLTASSVQPLLDRLSPTHPFCSQQACRILRGDGLEREASLFEVMLPQLETGSNWADRGWRNVNHYYDPETGTGLWRYPNAAEACGRYFHRALGWFKSNPGRAFFYLGAATHLVQDVCVPHHASGQLWNGHKEFESRAAEQRFLHTCWDSGHYWISAQAGGWIARNAHRAKCLTRAAGENASPASMDEAIGTLLPIAQRSTAGFWRFFLDQAGVSGGACYRLASEIKEAS